MTELTREELEALADEIRPPSLHVEPDATGSKVKTGRPPALSRRDEFELYCYRKAGIALKTCASMWRVSVPTAKRIVAKFRRYDELIEPAAREFRAVVNSVRDST